MIVITLIVMMLITVIMLVMIKTVNSNDYVNDRIGWEFITNIVLNRNVSNKNNKSNNDCSNT